MKKNYSVKNLNKSLIALLMVFCALFADSALAQKNINWKGTTNNDWSTASNWNYSGVTTTGAFASASPTVYLSSANTDIAIGDKVEGFGIAQGTLITAIDATKKIITISQNTYVALGVIPTAALPNLQGANITFTFATPKVATSPPGVVDIAVINNGGNPTLAAGSYYLGGLTIGNKTGAVTGSTLTIPSNVEVYIETLTNEGLLVKGGNIVNNGYLDVKSGYSGGNNNFAGAYAMTFGLPEVIPTVATDYTYSGNGLLFIDSSAGNNFSGGFLFNGVGTNANLATYKLLFNGTETFLLSAATATNGTATTHLFRAIGVGTFNACKTVIGGSGFTFGTVSAGATNGLIAVSGGGVDISIAQGTTINMFSASTNPTPTFSMYVFGATSLPAYLTNKGTVIVKGSMSRSPISLSAQNNGIANFVNEGTLDIDVNSTTSGQGGISVTNNQGATLPADVNVTNTGTMSIKTLLNGPSWGAPIVMTTFPGAPNLHVNNSGTLNLIGSNFNFGSKVYDGTSTTQTGASRITNSGTINTNQEFRAFYTINTSTGKITFASTPATTKFATLTITGIIAVKADVGDTYTDANLNVHTVVLNLNKAAVTIAPFTPTTASLLTNVAINAAIPAAAVLPATTVVLTKTSGTGDATITYTNPVTLNNSAFFAATLNSGVINTNTGTTAMTNISGVKTEAATSVLSPGGDTGKSIAVFGEITGDAYALKGTLKMQVSGNTTAGVDYDLVRFTGQLDVIDISSAILDVTGIYTPTAATTIDIITTNTTDTFEGAILNGGPFASVIGLTPGWAVNYSALPGKVQLSFDPALSTSDVAFSNFKFNFYPNPTSNQINLSAEKNISKVELYNLLGQKVQSNTVNAAQKQLNIAHLAKGVYLMEVSIDKAKKTFKVVKQ